MKRVIALTMLLALAWVAPAAARPADFWQLGYAPRAPFAQYPAWAVRNDAERYRVAVTGYFGVRANPAGENVRVYLPLPADDIYQRVYVSRMRPAPVEILVSAYGYRIAAFDFGRLPPGASFLLTYDAEVTAGKVRWPIDPRQVGTLAEIPEAIRRDYLVDGPFYRLDSPKIARATTEAVGGERHPYFIISRIVSYVRERLEYRLDGQKLDAPSTLERGEGSCSEFSFVLIAMARRAGLPARYASGSVVRPHPFTRRHYDHVYHKIVEVYLPRVGWVPVESTGSRSRAIYEPERTIGLSAHRMLFFAHEPEPGLAPLDPRRDIITPRPYGIDSRIEVRRQVSVQWLRLDRR